MQRLYFSIFAIAAFCGVNGLATAGTITHFDFSTDSSSAGIVNGQQIDDEFASIFTVTVPTRPDATGVAAFDTSPTGPNIGDVQLTDMLVDLGNVLVYQSGTKRTQTVPGIYDRPTDNPTGGTIIFDFTNPSAPTSITLIDLDDNAGANVRLTDASGNLRTYAVPDEWTHDLRKSPKGYADLDLTTLADQTGETANVATATEDAGFDGNSVMRMEIELLGSGGVDNLVLSVVPEPSSIGGLSIAMLALLRRARRQN